MRQMLFAVLMTAAVSVSIAEPVREKAAAPGFTVTTLDGRASRLSSLRGKIVLLDFGAVNCPPCRIEMPILEAWHRKYGRQGVVVLGLMEMNPTDREVRKMVKARGITYPVAIDKGERIGKRYGLIAHPTTVLIDRAGRVVRLETGFVRGDEKEIEAALKTLLAPKSTEGARQ